MFCISINYKNAGIELRRSFAFSMEVQKKIMYDLIANKEVTECIFLCTCNRTEIYFCGTKTACDHVKKVLARYSGVDYEILASYLMTFYNENAVKHLFKVACGIDSMVIGEDEILGQTKNAYMLSKELGYVSYELNMIFQSAICCAKKVKTLTALSKTSVSIATLAANEAAKFKENVNVLIIGATGKTGMTVLKNLISHKNVTLTATIRHHNSLFDSLISENVRMIDYSDRYDGIGNADCVISATFSPHFTVTRRKLEPYIAERKERLFIDLAVPPDIDESIGNIDGVKLISIDYFEKLARENNLLKLDSVESAKEIISEEIDTLKKELDLHDFYLFCDDVEKKASALSTEQVLYKLKSGLNSEQFSAVLEVLKSSLGGS